MRKKIEEKNLRESFEKVKKDIDDLGERMEMLEKSKSPSSLKVQESKTSLRQVQERYVLNKFRQSKKKIAKEKIIEYTQQNIPIPNIKIKIMNELNISKASFYNYVNELVREGSLKVQESKSLNKELESKSLNKELDLD